MLYICRTLENFNQNKFAKTDTVSSLDDNELFATRLVWPHLIKTMPICILVGKNKRRRRSENIFFSSRYFSASCRYQFPILFKISRIILIKYLSL